MTTPAADAVFVDTNVWVFAAVPAAPMHAAAVATLDALSPGALWISRQVLREFLAVLSRPQTFFAGDAPMPNLVARASVIEARCNVAEDGPLVTRKLHELLTSHETRGKQIHDANIVATMLVRGIGSLLTHNAGDFQRWSGMIRVALLRDYQASGKAGAFEPAD